MELNKDKQIEKTYKIQPNDFKVGYKDDEMRHLVEQMEKAISTEREKRFLADERKLEEVLKANGWRKASEVAREIFAEIDSLLENDEKDFDKVFEESEDEGENQVYLALTNYVYGIRKMFAELKKKYTEGGE